MTCNRSARIAVFSGEYLLSHMKNRIVITAAVAAVSLLTTFSAHAADANARKEKAAAAFAAADKDGDGKLNPAEFAAFNKNKLDAAAAKAKFAETDTNKDGYVTREELRAAMGNHGGKKPKQ